MIRYLTAALLIALFALTSCVQHSPGARVSIPMHISVSIVPAAPFEDPELNRK